jgi:hypothetical protein
MRGIGLWVAVIAIASILTLSSPAAAQDGKPDATLRLSQTSVAFILGYTWGSGSLTFQDKIYRVEVGAFSVLSLGVVKAIKLLTDNATYTADVVGYTDDVGSSGSNVNLSWRREEIVRRFMVERGAELNRFSFIGFGEDLAKGTAPASRAQDRHVMVRVFRPAD